MLGQDSHTRPVDAALEALKAEITKNPKPSRYSQTYDAVKASPKPTYEHWADNLRCSIAPSTNAESRDADGHELCEFLEKTCAWKTPERQLPQCFAGEALNSSSASSIWISAPLDTVFPRGADFYRPLHGPRAARRGKTRWNSISSLTPLDSVPVRHLFLPMKIQEGIVDSNPVLMSSTSSPGSI